MLFGTICTFFSGCSNSLWCVIAGSTINELTSIAGMKDLPDDQYNEKIKGIKDPVNKLIILFVTLGALTLISNFFMLFLWGYSALKQMDTLKIKYFELILNQEQSWFDEHNSFEFATKVQSQLDQVELV
jgi:ABC-type multidrug transport system fused ATPase/permease subunit